MRILLTLPSLLLRGAVAAAVLAFAGGNAAAETLADAIAAALARHPVLRAEEARGRAASHGIDIARSGYYPRLTATGEAGLTNDRRDAAVGSARRPPGRGGLDPDDRWTDRWAYGLSAEQPLFDGFRTRNAVAEARAGAQAADTQIRVSAQVVQLEAVAAFCDVIRDREVETLRRREVDMLRQQVAAAQERARRGVGTETEIAQARVRSALALADLLTARGNLAASAAEYLRVTGREPRNLLAPQLPASRLPRSLADAIAAADATNPASHAARFREEASRHGVERVRADGLPQVALRAGVNGERSLSAERDGKDGASIGVKVSVPLFDGGESAARVRQAFEASTSLTEEARAVQEKVKASVSQAWARLSAYREKRDAEEKAVAESRKALAGILEEIRLGQRPLIEGLDAQREVSTAEARIAATRRDMIVSAYALLSDMGALAAAHESTETQATSAPGRSWRTSIERSSP